jgi:hypothetical protein
MVNYPTIRIGETIRIVNVMQDEANYPLYQIQELVTENGLWIFWDGYYSKLSNAIREVEQVLHVKVITR